MTKINFPYIAFALGLVFTLVVMKGSETNDSGVTSLPLLTLLVISEFSFFVTAIGALIGFQHFKSASRKPIYLTAIVLCLLLAVRFMLLGIELWPK